MKNLLIEYVNPSNFADSITIKYALRSHSVVGKWIMLVREAQSRYRIDDPDRFYGFDSLQIETEKALAQINACIDTINQHEIIITRNLSSVDDQDTLNYLHSIFEKYHGLLDEQTHEFWMFAPKSVRRALANLNVLVHKCESVNRGNFPRHVVTWYDLPKTQTLTVDEYQFFEEGITFGTVYLNYVEIGKTFEDLALDNDNYISDEAFRPFQHYSADFNVKFYSSCDRQLQEHRVRLQQYYDSNKEFFVSRGLDSGHDYLRPGAIPLADLRDEDLNIINEIKSRQFVKSVTFE